jgi:hypothetical protein
MHLLQRGRDVDQGALSERQRLSGRLHVAVAVNVHADDHDQVNQDVAAPDLQSWK